MTSALMTATGSDFGLLTANPGFELTALYHMYVTGMTSLFNYGDHGQCSSSLFLSILISSPRSEQVLDHCQLSHLLR